MFRKLADRLKEVIIIKKHCLGPLEGGRGCLIGVAVQLEVLIIFNNFY